MVLQVATGLAAGCLPQGSCAARIMLLVGGPATAGPGKVVDMELSEPIRWIFLFDDFLATVVCCAGGHCSQAACGSVVPNRSTCQLSAIVFLSAALEVMHLLFCQSCVCSQFLLLHKIAPVLPRRSHKDLAKESAQHYKKARKFYDGLAAQLVQQGHALDVFACALDQVGPPWTAVCCSAAWQCKRKDRQAVSLMS